MFLFKLKVANFPKVKFTYILEVKIHLPEVKVIYFPELKLYTFS